MSNSLFCPNCGMLKTNCTCGNSTNKKSKGPTNLFSFKKPISHSILDDEIPEVYSIDNHKLDEGTVAYLKELYPHIDEEIIENFPFTEPRFGQLDIIQNINDAIRQGYKYIILEAGTGTGKSAIATTLAKMYESAYILTMTKQLQSQYSNEFDFPLVKGRGNFACLNSNLDATCDMGTCKTTPTSSNFFCSFGVAKNPTLDAELAFEDSYGGAVFYQSSNHCHYWNQKANAINSPITLMNYDYAIVELNYVKHFAPRSLLILDEAHNIENKLMATMEVTLYNRTLEKDINKRISDETLKNGELEDWKMEIDAIRDSYEDIDLKDVTKNKADRIRSTISRLKTLSNNLEKEPKNWVIDAEEAGVVFKPLRVHHYAKDNLLKYGDVVIFMSATILSHKMFSKWLGLNPNEVYHIKVDSPFTKEKRPIILNLAGKMSANRIKNTAPKTIPILQEILKKHENDKGLIHTHSYKCQQYIVNNLYNSRLISHSSKNREQILNFFEKDENPLVLVSPSMSEGVDLPYDKCRFQIIYKMPFPYLGDKQVNMRMKRDKKWYAYKTVMTLMQAYGRGMRAEDDSCYTYIIDSDINMLFKSPMYRSLIPDFFKEAVVRVKN
ncbi:helicase C-terminal domain-containing protein [Methanobrevibacter sp.]|uniref:helicase C-terminal domain-containing protein n=1 Tax=Methanobrevibacter sp. TaxID=66852 RepID=UPI0038705366